MKPIMKTWKIIINCVLAAFGILSIVVSVFGLKTLQEHPEIDNKSLYGFIIFMIVLGVLCCVGVIIWVCTDLLITMKNPDNAIDEKATETKYKIRKYKNNFGMTRLPTLSKKIDDNVGFFASDLKYSEEYKKNLNQNQTNSKPTKSEKIALQVAKRQQQSKNKKTKHK